MNRIGFQLPTATFRRVRPAAGGSKRSINSWLLCLVERYLHQVDARRLPVLPTIPEIPEVAEAEPSTLRVRPVADDVIEIEVVGHGARTALRLPVDAAVPLARLLLDQVV